MGQHSKRTRAPAPQLVPPSVPPSVPPLAPQSVPPRPPHLAQRPPPTFLPSTFTSAYGPGSWIPPRPPQSVAPSSASSWLAGLQQQNVAADSAEGPCWPPPADIGGSASPWYTTGNIDDSNPQAWGMDSYPPGGFLGFFKNTSSQAQAVSNGTPQQPINVGNDNNGGNCPRTEKRLLWTKEEDRRLVSAWLNN